MAELLDLTNDGLQLSAMDTGKIYEHAIDLDFVTTPSGAGDTIKAMTIPLGYEVSETRVLIVAQEQAADTLNIGDSSSATLFLNSGVIGASGTALNGTVLYGDASTGTTTVFKRKYYAAANYLLITTPAALTALVCRIIVTLRKLDA